jgi:hypothetical protein
MKKIFLRNKKSNFFTRTIFHTFTTKVYGKRNLQMNINKDQIIFKYKSYSNICENFYKFSFIKFHNKGHSSSNIEDTNLISSDEALKTKFSLIKKEDHFYNIVNIDKINNYSLKLKENILKNEKIKNYQFEQSFFTCLDEYYQELKLLSQNQFKLLYERDKLIFTRIRIIFSDKQTEFKSPFQAVSVMKIAYILEIKKTYSLSREENDAIVPKIKDYFNRKFSQFQINECLYMCMMLNYFGEVVNLYILKNKIVKQKESLSFELFSIVMEGLQTSKNNKVYDHKKELIFLLLDPYIELSYKQDPDLKSISFKVICNIYSEHFKNYHLLGLDLSKTKIFINSFIVQEKGQLSLRSITNFLNGIQFIEKTKVVSHDILKNQLDVIYYSFQESLKKFINYDHLNETLSNNNELNGITSNNRENKFGKFPVYFLIFKIISEFPNELLPDNKCLDIIYEYIDELFKYYESQSLSLKLAEINYLLILMRKKNYYKQSTLKYTLDYMTETLVSTKINKVLFDSFIFFLQKENNYKERIDLILNTLEKFANDYNNTFRYLLINLNKICFFEQFSSTNQNLSKFNLAFENITKNLKLVSDLEKNRRLYNNLPFLLEPEKNYFSDKHKLKIIDYFYIYIEKYLDDDKASSDYQSKMFIFLNELKIDNDVDDYKEINNKIDFLVKKFLQNNNSVLKTSLLFKLRLYELSRSVIITHKTLKTLNNMIENDPTIMLIDRNIGNLTKFIEFYECNHPLSDSKINKEIEKLKKYAKKSLYVAHTKKN